MLYLFIPILLELEIWRTKRLKTPDCRYLEEAGKLVYFGSLLYCLTIRNAGLPVYSVNIMVGGGIGCVCAIVEHIPMV